MSEWISVKDSLPGEKDYLATWDGVKVSQNVLFDWRENIFYISVEGADGYETKPPERPVTHWLPFPKVKND